ncbi:hypothetical protein Cantr_09736 [Candida viswanathii]|uniref:Uncharacterized protein n=1 Tax=Candida viswanathii TaxID=5486 RepID=A0A367YE86_9ASCO|nr:hypothetical protein Cantr_09736 [Candida viswanathii]
MDPTILELNTRINNLELTVSQKGGNDADTLSSQISALKLKLASVYQTHPEFERLNELNTRLKTLNKTAPRQEDDGVSDEVKLETVNLHRNEILETYPAIVELLNIQYASIINNINNAIMTTDIQNNTEVLVSKRNQLEHITKLYQILNVKSMLIVERYTELCLRDNKFWVELEKQLEGLNQKIKQIEDTKKQHNKY